MVSPQTVTFMVMLFKKITAFVPDSSEQYIEVPGTW